MTKCCSDREQRVKSNQLSNTKAQAQAQAMPIVFVVGGGRFSEEMGRRRDFQVVYELVLAKDMAGIGGLFVLRSLILEELGS